MPASIVCPHCRQLNAGSETHCFRCGQALQGPGAWLQLRTSVDYLATKVLLGLCIANFAVMILVERGLPLAIFGRGPRVSSILQVGGIAGSVGADTEVYRWLSAVFVHLGVLHLFMNMSALLWLGRLIEDALGAWRMVFVFVLAGIGGFALSRLYYGSTSPPTAGASGALFGLLGAQLAEMHHRKDPRFKDVLLQYGAYAIAFALLWPVNNAAHLGGFLVGFGSSKGLIRLPRSVAWDSLGNKLGFALLLLCLASQVAAFVSPAAGRARRLEAAIQRLSVSD